MLRAIDEHRRALGPSLHPVRFLEDRYQALVSKYYETGKSPLPCTALSSSCFIDAYWNLFACSIWDAKVGNLRENGFDLRAHVGEPAPARAARRCRSASAARTAGRRARRIPRSSAIWRARRRNPPAQTLWSCCQQQNNSKANRKFDGLLLL